MENSQRLSTEYSNVNPMTNLISFSGSYFTMDAWQTQLVLNLYLLYLQLVLCALRAYLRRVGHRRFWRAPHLARREIEWLNVVPIFRELGQENPSLFKVAFGMLPSSFDRLLGIIGVSITKEDRVRLSIPPELRLQIFLW